MTPMGEFESIKAAEFVYKRQLFYAFKTRTDEFYYLPEIEKPPKPIPVKPPRADGRRNRPHARASWQIASPLKAPERLGDPRVPITRHIDWTTPWQASTTWSQPEPDNYNRAILASRPYDIQGIRSQCWYQLPRNPNWFSVYYCATESEIDIWTNWVKINPVIAVWAHTAHPIRRRLNRIEQASTRQWGRVKLATEDERMIDQGFTEKLILKGADPDYIAHYMGRRRPELADTNQMATSAEYTEDY